MAERFFKLLPEIYAFLQSIRVSDFDYMSTDIWKLQLAFLCDITNHLNSLNESLQGSNILLPVSISRISAFLRNYRFILINSSNQIIHIFRILKKVWILKFKTHYFLLKLLIWNQNLVNVSIRKLWIFTNWLLGSSLTLHYLNLKHWLLWARTLMYLLIYYKLNLLNYKLILRLILLDLYLKCGSAFPSNTWSYLHRRFYAFLVQHTPVNKHSLHSPILNLSTAPHFPTKACKLQWFAQLHLSNQIIWAFWKALIFEFLIKYMITIFQMFVSSNL